MLIFTVIKFKVPSAKVIECPIVNPVITSKSSLPQKAKLSPAEKLNDLILQGYAQNLI